MTSLIPYDPLAALANASRASTGVLTEFHRFPDLPAEVRVMIWKLASTRPRIVNVTLAAINLDDYDYVDACWILMSTNPAVLHATSESRVEGLKHYKNKAFPRTLPDGTTIREIYLDPYRDILVVHVPEWLEYLANEWIEFDLTEGREEREDHVSKLSEKEDLRSMACPWEEGTHAIVEISHCVYKAPREGMDNRGDQDMWVVKPLVQARDSLELDAFAEESGLPDDSYEDGFLDVDELAWRAVPQSTDIDIREYRWQARSVKFDEGWDKFWENIRGHPSWLAGEIAERNVEFNEDGTQAQRRRRGIDVEHTGPYEVDDESNSSGREESEDGEGEDGGDEDGADGEGGDQEGEHDGEHEEATSVASESGDENAFQAEESAV